MHVTSYKYTDHHFQIITKAEIHDHWTQRNEQTEALAEIKSEL